MSIKTFRTLVNIKAAAEGNASKTIELLKTRSWETPWHGEFEIAGVEKLADETKAVVDKTAEEAAAKAKEVTEEAIAEADKLVAEPKLKQIRSLR